MLTWLLFVSADGVDVSAVASLARQHDENADRTADDPNRYGNPQENARLIELLQEP